MAAPRRRGLGRSSLTSDKAAAANEKKCVRLRLWGWGLGGCGGVGAGGQEAQQVDPEHPLGIFKMDTVSARARARVSRAE